MDNYTPVDEESQNLTFYKSSNSLDGLIESNNTRIYNTSTHADSKVEAETALGNFIFDCCGYAFCGGVILLTYVIARNMEDTIESTLD